MTALEGLGRQFDNTERLAQYRAAKSVPGREAPVMMAVPHARYAPNPFAAHIPPAVREDFEDGSYRMRPQHGLPGYDPAARHERVRGVQQLPLDRLESTQSHVNRDHARNMARRKGTAPPIEVTHYADQDRYVISEGNHRATVALMKGQTHIAAEVVRRTEWRR